MKIDFIKCHGSGNDFVLIDGLTRDTGIGERDLPEFSRLICDRKGPVGADGVLLLLPGAGADCRMRVFNADGSEAAMCGNGIRCVARLAAEILGKDSLTIAAMKAPLACRMEPEMFPGVASSSVLIDNVSLVSGDFPFAGGEPFIDRPIPGLGYDGRRFSAVSLGNPHIVSYTDGEISDAALSAIGQKANSDAKLFPEGANVTFFTAAGRQALFAATYERGVGLTNACGTAMSASTVAACIMGLCGFGEWTDVYNKGGMVGCLAEKDARGNIAVRLLGNATFEYRGSAAYSGGAVSEFSVIEEFTAETAAYTGFLAECRKRLGA